MDNWATEFDAVRLFKTSTGGGTNPGDWTDITPPTPGNTWGTYFSSDIAVSSNNPNKIWVSYSGYLEDYKIKMFDGEAWSDYQNGLPNLPVNCLAHINGSNDALFAGTDVGVYFRDAGMAQWEPFSESLPTVIVNWLEVNYTNQKLRAGTFGRGLWETDLPERTMTAAIEESENSLANLNSNILIFPNPNPGTFNISGLDELEISEIALFNLFGKKIDISMSQISKTTFNIEFENKQAGLYFLEIKTSKGKLLKKVLVE